MIPLAGFKTLLSGVQSGDLPRGKSLPELMGIVASQYWQDRKELGQEQRSTGESGLVAYSYTDPFFEETEIEEEPEPMEMPSGTALFPYMTGPERNYYTRTGRIPPGALSKWRKKNQPMSIQATKKAPSEFETWMASKYGG